ncbi:F-box/FBD/LRR-repeat protein At1g13570 [Linum grandiflorum]
MMKLSISQLPADVISLILSFLPIKEAVRTSILSTQWRHRWRSIPHLVFDANFATNDSDYDSDSDSESSEINKVMLQVYQTLLLHDGPIHKFELSIPNMNRCPQLHQLLLYLSTKSVNQLSLVFHHFGPYISLPSSIFAFPNLTSLKLQSFTFQLPNLQFAGFSKLAFVELNDVRLPIDFFENFISKCPLLQDLRVFDCDFGNRQESVFVSSSSVKVLIFRSSHPCTVRFIYTPSLSVLAVQQSYYHSHFYYYLNGILFGNFQQDMVALFNSLPALEHLNLGLDLLLVSYKFLCSSVFIFLVVHTTRCYNGVLL